MNEDESVLIDVEFVLYLRACITGVLIGVVRLDLIAEFRSS